MDSRDIFYVIYDFYNVGDFYTHDCNPYEKTSIFIAALYTAANADGNKY